MWIIVCVKNVWNHGLDGVCHATPWFWGESRSCLPRCWDMPCDRRSLVGRQLRTPFPLRHRPGQAGTLLPARSSLILPGDAIGGWRARTTAGGWVHCGACLDVAPSSTGRRLHMRVLPGRSACMLLASFFFLQTEIQTELGGVSAPRHCTSYLETPIQLQLIAYRVPSPCSRRGCRSFRQSAVSDRNPGIRVVKDDPPWDPARA